MYSSIDHINRLPLNSPSCHTPLPSCHTPLPSHHTPLPSRTAPEAITRAEFSSASDVWSYAVTVWEVYSLGKVPWKGLGPIEIRDLLVEGERLGRPERCPGDVFMLVQSCWRNNPQERPSFAEIHKRIQQVVLHRSIIIHLLYSDCVFFGAGLYWS